MPRKAPPKQVIPFFRLRAAASALLALGFLTCIVRLASLPEAGSGALSNNAAAIGPISPPAKPDTAPAAPLDPNVPAIVIDPGHGGTDPGTVANGQLEKTWTLSVALALAESLRQRGWPVELTRTDDSAVGLPDRSALSNQRPRLAFVSIHFNSGGPEATGMETYYAWPKNPEVMARSGPHSDTPLPAGVVLRDDRGRLLAEALQAAACSAVGSRNRGARNEPTYAVLNHTECPAALVECGFLTNSAECEAIQSEEWRRKLVSGLTTGLDSWLRMSRSPCFGLTAELPAEQVPVTADSLPSDTVR